MADAQIRFAKKLLTKGLSRNKLIHENRHCMQISIFCKFRPSKDLQYFEKITESVISRKSVLNLKIITVSFLSNKPVLEYPSRADRHLRLRIDGIEHTRIR